MNTLDLILIITIALFGLWGGIRGFIMVIGSLVGLFIAVILASHWYGGVAVFLGGSILANIVAFLMIFGLVIRLVTLAFWLLAKAFHFISFIPFLGFLERLMGLVLGLILGALCMAVIVYFMNRYPLNDWYAIQSQQSFMVPVLLFISQIVGPFIPEALKSIKGLV